MKTLPHCQIKVGTADQEFLVWQLADSAFPTGGFAHSGGLEAAWQHGEIRNTKELASFLEASLNQLAHGSLPFVTAAHAEPNETAALDSLCDNYLTNHVANRASRLQGRAFAAAAEKIFQARTPLLSFWHLAPVYGCVTSLLRLNRNRASQLFVFQHLRNLLAAAVRLGSIGPMEAQMLLRRLSAQAEAIACQYENLPISALAQTAPLLEIWQGTQDRLYSRLFQS